MTLKITMNVDIVTHILFLTRYLYCNITLNLLRKKYLH